MSKLSTVSASLLYAAKAFTLLIGTVIVGTLAGLSLARQKLTRSLRRIDAHFAITPRCNNCYRKPHIEYIEGKGMVCTCAKCGNVDVYPKV